MKCYHETGEASTKVSLPDALLKVSEFHCVDVYAAAGMLELSGPHKPVTVMDGTVWIEDDTPVLDIDKVIEAWFVTKARLVVALHPHKAFMAMVACNYRLSDEINVTYRFVLDYGEETKGAASEPTFNEFLRRVDWAKANEAKVLAIDHNPIE